MRIHRSAGDQKAIEAEHESTLRALASYPPVTGTHEYAASPHLIGYGPNYYMYLLDKVIALDFFARFASDTAGPTAAAYRREVIEPGARRSARDLVRDFLGREERLDALTAWMRGTAPPR